MNEQHWTQQVKLLGRTHLRGERLWLAYSGSGMGCMVTGKRCAIRLHGDSTAIPQQADSQDESIMGARYAVYVNGERTVCEMMDVKDRAVTVFDGDMVRTARVELVKLSESAMSTLAVDGIDTDGTVSPLPLRTPYIEFVGDSITCGYGVDTGKAEDKFHTCNEDVTKAYAWRTADLLEADRSMVCLSGYGVLSGWTADPEKPSEGQLIPLYYEKCGFSYADSDGEHAENWTWDFSGREPDAIVINLGTNDASYTVDDPGKQAQYRARYKAFLRQIRRCNPHAKLLCVLGAMGDLLYPSLEQAAAEYKAESGDERVWCMPLTPIQPDTEGYVADFHPTVITHKRCAAAVAEKLRALLA